MKLFFRSAVWLVKLILIVPLLSFYCYHCYLICSHFQEFFNQQIAKLKAITTQSLPPSCFSGGGLLVFLWVSMHSDSILLLIDHCDFYKVRWMNALGLFETFNKFLFFFFNFYSGGRVWRPRVGLQTAKNVSEDDQSTRVVVMCV